MQQIKIISKVLRIVQIVAVIFLSLMMARAVKLLFGFMQGEGTP